MPTIGEIITKCCKDFLAAEGDLAKQARISAVMFWILTKNYQRVRAWKQKATKQ